MLTWVLIFLLIAIIAALFGFTGIARVAAGIAKVIFFIFLVLFVIFLILYLFEDKRKNISIPALTHPDISLQTK